MVHGGWCDGVSSVSRSSNATVPSCAQARGVNGLCTRTRTRQHAATAQLRFLQPSESALSGRADGDRDAHSQNTRGACNAAHQQMQKGSALIRA